MLKRNNKKTSKKPKSPPSHKSVTNKRARMMCPRRKIVPTARNLVSDSQRGLRLGMHSRGKQPAQSWTDIEGPPGAKGHASAAGSEANEARRGQAESGLDTGHDGWRGPDRSTRLRAAPLASPPTFSGPEPDSDGGRGARAGRGEEAASRPAPRGRWTWPGSRGRESCGQRGAHLSTRAASAGVCATEELCVRLVGVLTQVRTIPPRGRLTPPPSQHPQPPQSPGAGSSLALGSRPRAAGEHAQSPRSRGNPAGDRYLRSTGPGPRPRP